MTAPKMYSVEHLLPFARAALKVSASFSSEQFADVLFTQLAKAQVPGVVRSRPPQSTRLQYQYGGPAFPLELKNGVAELFWYLIHQGYIVPEWRDFPIELAGWMHFRRTERGTQWVNGAEPMLEDLSGYMVHVMGRAAHLDMLIRQYLQEGLGALNRGLYFSAVVMLGAASEKEIYLLGTSMVSALQSATHKTDLEGLLRNRSLYRLLNFIGERVRGVNFSVRQSSGGVFDGAEAHLMSLFESIRAQRNDAVHPNTGTCDEKSVRMAYEAFPAAIEKAEELRHWCGKNPNTL